MLGGTLVGITKILFIALCLEGYGVFHHFAMKAGKKRTKKNGYAYRETWLLALTISFFCYGLVVIQLS